MLPWFVLVLLSAAILAVAEIIRKHVLNHEHSLEQVVAEAPFRILFVALFIPLLEPLSMHQYVMIAMASAILLTLLIFRNKSMRHLPISTIAPLQNLSPILLLVFATVFLGERPSPMQLLGILLIVIGGYALEARGKSLLGPLTAASKNTAFRAVAAFLVLLSIMATTDKFLLGNARIPVFTYLFWLYLFTGIGSVALHWSLYRLKGLRKSLRKGWWWLMLIAAAAVFNISLFYKALAMPGVLISLAVPIRRVATLLETIFGGKLFGEENVWRKAAGCLVMLLGVLLIV